MKREVQIIGVSYSQSQPNAYIVVLSETNGHRKIPVIVKAQDAQTIAVKIEKLKLPRPTTHDVLKSLCDGFQIDCQEVCIYKMLEGIFYSKIVTNNGVDDLEVETTVGDAISLALTFGSPIYVTEEVLSTCGVETNEDGEVIESKPKRKRKPKNVVSVEDLRKMMEEAIKNEDYEVAAELRDKISKMESQK